MNFGALSLPDRMRLRYLLLLDDLTPAEARELEWLQRQAAATGQVGRQESAGERQAKLDTWVERTKRDLREGR